MTSHEDAQLLQRDAVGYLIMEYGDNVQNYPAHVADVDIRRHLEHLFSNVRIMSARDLPAWPADAPGIPPSDGEGAAYEAALPRELYEEIRRRDLRLLCFDSGPETAECHIYDPLVRSSVLVARFGL